MPLILLTGYTDDAIVKSALELNVNAYVVKPVSRDNLLSKLARVLEMKIDLKKPTAYNAVELPALV